MDTLVLILVVIVLILIWSNIHKFIFVSSIIVGELTSLDSPIGTHYRTVHELFTLEIPVKLLPMLVYLSALSMTLIVQKLALVKKIAPVIFSVSFFDTKKIKFIFLLYLPNSDLLKQLVVIFITKNKAFTEIYDFFVFMW